jgi:tetratricopeptide (TPR) repeat protein
MKKNYAALLIVVMISCGYVLSVAASDDIAAITSFNLLLRDGNNLREAKKYIEALEAYNKALELDLSKNRKTIVYHFIARTHADRGNGILLVNNLAKFIVAARSFDLDNEADMRIYRFYHISNYLREAKSYLTGILRRSSPSRNIIGIVSFKEDTEGIAQIIEKGFIDVSPFKVIDSRWFEELLKEPTLSPSPGGIVDEKTVVSLGKAAGLHYVILGYVKKLEGDRLLLSIKFIDTETGELVSEVSEKAVSAEIKSLGSSIAFTICADFFIKNYIQ